MSNTKNQKYLTCNEAAEIMEVTPDYIRKMIIRKQLKAEKLGDTHIWLVRKSSLNRAIRRRAALLLQGELNARKY